MPDSMPTERESAVQYYAEEVRRHELLEDAIRVVQNHAHRLVSSTARQTLYGLHASIKEAAFADLQRAFQRAVEAEDK